MSAYNVILDYTHGTVQLNDLFCVPMANKDSRQRVVRTARALCVPAMSEAIIPVCVHKRFTGQNILLVPPPAHAFDKFATARCVVRPTACATVCRILNYNEHPLVLRRHECVAVIADIVDDDELISHTVNRLSSEIPAGPSQPSPIGKPTREELDKFVNSMGLNISPKASTDDRYQIAELLFEFQDLFKTSVKDIKQCNIKPFEIKLRSDKGAYTRQYKLTPDDSAEVERQIDGMLQANVIEPAIGVEAQKYNTPVALYFLYPSVGELRNQARGTNSLPQLPQYTVF
jgi:hypothetical protein